MFARVGLLVLLLHLSVAALTDKSWIGTDKVLLNAVEDGAFPGVVSLIADSSGILHTAAVGKYTYGRDAPLGGTGPMRRDTRFDMASLTKVVATTTAVAQLYEQGFLRLDTPVVKLLGPGYGVNGKREVTVLNCLLHNAGYGPDPNPFWNTEQFGCPQTAFPDPREDFSCMAQIYQSFLNTALVRPPNTKYVYSDLSFITLMFVVGAVAHDRGLVDPTHGTPSSCAAFSHGPAAENPASARSWQNPGHALQCYFLAYVNKFVVERLALPRTGFLPAESVWSQCAPTANDTTYRHRVVQGQVQDQNTYAMGGISGHAGLFSTVDDIYQVVRRIMWAPKPSLASGSGSNQASLLGINSTTAEFFTTEYNHTQSSRALGWNTNDGSVVDRGWNKSCGSLSDQSWMHLGYTGGMICADPQRQLILVMLTNRVYPSVKNLKIERVRQIYASSVQQTFDALHSHSPIVTVTSERRAGKPRLEQL